MRPFVVVLSLCFVGAYCQSPSSASDPRLSSSSLPRREIQLIHELNASGVVPREVCHKLILSRKPPSSLVWPTTCGREDDFLLELVEQKFRRYDKGSPLALINVKLGGYAFAAGLNVPRRRRFGAAPPPPKLRRVAGERAAGPGVLRELRGDAEALAGGVV